MSSLTLQGLRHCETHSSQQSTQFETHNCWKNTKQKHSHGELNNRSQMKSIALFPLQKSLYVCSWNRNTRLHLKDTVCKRCNLEILHISHSETHSPRSFRLSQPQQNTHLGIRQKTNLTLSCYRYTQHREAAVEREGERKRKRTTVLALSHFAESQPRHRHCGPAKCVKF